MGVVAKMLEMAQGAAEAQAVARELGTQRQRRITLSKEVQ
jgi:hypothetical protein